TVILWGFLIHNMFSKELPGQQMFYKEFLPTWELRNYVKCFWIVRHCGKKINHFEKLIPSGGIDIIFQKNNSAFNTDKDTSKLIEIPQFVLGPQLKQSLDLSIMGKLDVFGIRFYPYSFYELTGIPLSVFKNH